jgi:hypothetical protein
MNGIEAIEAERREQIEAHSYAPFHDNIHTHGEMLKAAGCYLLLAEHQVNQRLAFAAKMMLETPKNWPWDPMDWHPSGISKNNLKKAGALIAAEWDRVDRAGF